METERILSAEQMKKLTTKRLLGYRNALLACHDTKHDEAGPNDDELTKDMPEWAAAHDAVIAELNQREHVE